MGTTEIQLLAIYLLFAGGTYFGFRAVDNDPGNRITPVPHILAALVWPLIWIALGVMALCNLADKEKP